MLNLYGVAQLGAIFLGLFVIWREVGRRGFREEKILDLLLLIGAFALFSSRISFLTLSRQLSLTRILFFWQGERLFFGGILGGFFALWIGSKRNRWSVLDVGDALAPGLLFMQVLSNFFCTALSCGNESAFLEGAFYLLIYYMFVNRQRLIRTKTHLSGNLLFSYLVVISAFPLVSGRFLGGEVISDYKLSVAVLLLAVVGFSRGVYLHTAKSSEDRPFELSRMNERKTRREVMIKIGKIPKISTQIPRRFIKKMRFVLKRREKEIQQELDLLEKEDPYKDRDRTSDNAEYLSESAEQSRHVTVMLQVKHLRNSLKAVRGALHRIKEGTYGFSIKSGLPIRKDRLKANPSADLTKEEAEQREEEESREMPPMERIS